MVKLSKPILLALVTAVVGVAALFAAVLAVGSMPEVHDVFIRLGTNTGGIFFVLHNHGLSGDCVVGVEVEGVTGAGSRAKVKSELHKTEIGPYEMKMVKVDRVCIGPMSEVRFTGVEGEGYHVMIFGNVHDYKKFHITLIFESGKRVSFDATPSDHTSDHGHRH
ncbi:MAG: copper chaperone PCu(A)C [Aigarchaeota archaeon]|nr:copper chaperone PCu(A)C [Aigarchaeota archaeon]MDW8092281.1 copper chaperone PCu(A)C [Nitrososphaerota archaeon]